MNVSEAEREPSLAVTLRSSAPLSHQRYGLARAHRTFAVFNATFAALSLSSRTGLGGYGR